VKEEKNEIDQKIKQAQDTDEHYQETTGDRQTDRKRK
jgi:hypothetical protein